MLITSKILLASRYTEIYYQWKKWIFKRIDDDPVVGKTATCLHVRFRAQDKIRQLGKFVKNNKIRVSEQASRARYQNTIRTLNDYLFTPKAAN